MTYLKEQIVNHIAKKTGRHPEAVRDVLCQLSPLLDFGGQPAGPPATCGAEANASGLRPMPEAPRDGTPVLLFGGETTCEVFPLPVSVAYWVPELGSWVVAFTEGGYARVEYEGEVAWMPLPDVDLGRAQGFSAAK